MLRSSYEQSLKDPQSLKKAASADDDDDDDDFTPRLPASASEAELFTSLHRTDSEVELDERENAPLFVVTDLLRGDSPPEPGDHTPRSPPAHSAAVDMRVNTRILWMSIFAALLLALTMAAQRATPPSQRPEGEKEPSWFVKAKPRQRPSSWETLASAIGDSAETAAEPETEAAAAVAVEREREEKEAAAEALREASRVASEAAAQAAQQPQPPAEQPLPPRGRRGRGRGRGGGRGGKADGQIDEPKFFVDE